MTFDEDLDFSGRANALADEFYREFFQQFGDVQEIERFPNGTEKHILDREFAIDVQIHCISGVVFTLQEKFRRPQYQTFQDITIEYQQNRHTGEKGDFFRLAVDYYAYGYADHAKKPEKFLEFYLLDYCKLKQLLAQQIVPYKIMHSSSNASMLTVPIDKIPENVMVFTQVKSIEPLDSKQETTPLTELF